MVTEFVPAVIVPLTVPPSAPVTGPGLSESVTLVFVKTFVAIDALFRDWTTTENAVPNVGFTPPFTERTASLLAGAGLNVRFIGPMTVAGEEPAQVLSL